MNSNLTAERFTRNVDALLQGNHFPPADWLTHDERLVLDLAERLSTADFSRESKVRQTLRLRLIETSARRQDLGNRSSRAPFLRPIWFLAMAVLLGLVFFLASPVGNSLAQDAVQIIEEWVFGENTSLLRVQGDFQVNPGEDGQPVLSAPPETGEMVGEDNTMTNETDFTTAGQEPAFRVRQPTTLPIGYVFDGSTVLSPDQVELTYENRVEGRLLSILQTAVGERKDGVEIFSTDDIPVENVTVAGHEGAWFQGEEDSLLVWEADGVNFQLAGDLSLGEALAVAESLQ